MYHKIIGLFLTICLIMTHCCGSSQAVPILAKNSLNEESKSQPRRKNQNHSQESTEGRIKIIAKNSLKEESNEESKSQPRRKNQNHSQESTEGRIKIIAKNSLKEESKSQPRRHRRKNQNHSQETTEERTEITTN
ncbi:hypothetical protein FF38_02360 [Lucilia cuprina]|uniref:Uncharacterized protein n=1 Tax=Lucilia cuprina TaxID=7375 RepID=A0A0L0CAG2_LUCCU|nr:hypothetical protein FF38_02360 [Lucilia cuprina]